ncbi:outer membrane protein transport protein [Aliihoeflea sp. PC F10.4]
MTGFTKIMLAGTVLAASVATAQAGGFSRGNADTDVLYEPGNFTMRTGITIVSPQRSFTRHNDPALVGHRFTESYAVPSLAMKLQPFDALGCAGTYTQPYGADVNYEGRVTPGKLTEQFDVDEFALTCALRFDAGPGKLYLLGGVFHEKFDYSRTQLVPTGLLIPGAPGTLNAGLTLEGTDQGYRIGVGYDIPEIALRGQLMYRSATSYGADGEFTIQTPFGPLAAPALGLGNLPQSVELKLQSGIAPGWLAFGSVKWTDWSVQEALIVQVPGLITSNDIYNWRDGWTVTGGIGHAFNEQMNGVASVTYDRGVATGWDLIGDSWTFSVGGSLRDQFGGELRAGVGVSYLASVDAPFHPENQAVGSDWATGVSLGYRINW